MKGDTKLPYDDKRSKRHLPLDVNSFRQGTSDTKEDKGGLEAKRAMKDKQ